MKMPAEQIRKLQSGGAKVKRTKAAPAEKESKVPAPKVVVASGAAPPMPKIPDYGKELRTLISTLDNRLQRTRVPWRIKVNRTNSGLAESYDVIPLEID